MIELVIEEDVVKVKRSVVGTGYIFLVVVFALTVYWKDCNVMRVDDLFGHVPASR